jgi:hypothetical protein
MNRTPSNHFDGYRDASLLLGKTGWEGESLLKEGSRDGEEIAEFVANCTQNYPLITAEYFQIRRGGKH